MENSNFNVVVVESKILKVEQLNSSSFNNSVRLLYNGVNFPNNDITTIKKLLAHIKDKEQTGVNVGFKFSNEDVIQWIDDLDFLIELYKQLFNVNHLQSSFKLRSLIKELTGYILGASSSAKKHAASDPKQLIKDVFEEIKSAKVITNRDEEPTPVSEIRLKYDLKAEEKRNRSNKKSNENVK
ncbi:hypothetical protein [Pedobacter nanyangensis]|uniref:hypothetical protein n=1 Tax=Pedobacter nanyangensis TaxID=1562389 RepID=UPI000DE4017E|nr:hypothetical protein [Pedobacter nanyangensis]